jgi:hypothetical protein
MTISNEAFEAAKKVSDDALPYLTMHARLRVALEAAAPIIHAEALEEAVDAFPLETIVAPDNAVVWLAARARRVRSPTEEQPHKQPPALADPEELEKAGPPSAMAERGRRGGESSDRVGGHGDGGR